MPRPGMQNSGPLLGRWDGALVRNSQFPGLVLGFAGCAPEELRRGVDVLAAVLAKSSGTGGT